MDNRVMDSHNDSVDLLHNPNHSCFGAIVMLMRSWFISVFLHIGAGFDMDVCDCSVKGGKYRISKSVMVRTILAT